MAAAKKKATKKTVTKKKVSKKVAPKRATNLKKKTTAKKATSKKKRKVTARRKQQPRKNGHFAGYSEEQKEKFMDTICRRMADGESLHHITNDAAAKKGGMPARYTIMGWMAENPVFRERYDTAVEVRCEFLMDEILTIADRNVDVAGAVARDALRVTSRWRAAGVMNRPRFDPNYRAAGTAEDPIHHKNDLTAQLKILSDEDLQAEIDKARRDLDAG